LKSFRRTDLRIFPSPIPAEFIMFTLPELPYDYEAMEPYLDAATMHLHHDKHHAAYTKNLNDALAVHPDFIVSSAEDLLRDLSKVPEDIRTKVKNNGGGYVNHNFYWSVMSQKPSKPSEKLLSQINSTFGSLDNFKDKFQATAVGHFGSGWGWLVADKNKLTIIDTSNQDSPLTLGQTPLLTVDVWEHAYYLKYQNRRPEYIEAWWNVINWNKVSELFNQL
jgi:superoxide dismutase, Fe-Mn family